MPDASHELAALARVHAERAIRRLAVIIDAPWTSTNARIAAARVLLSLAAGKPAKAPRPKPAARPVPRAIRIDWAEPGAAADTAASPEPRP